VAFEAYIPYHFFWFRHDPFNSKILLDVFSNFFCILYEFFLIGNKYFRMIFSVHQNTEGGA
jgi:hypothetical protein